MSHICDYKECEGKSQHCTNPKCKDRNNLMKKCNNGTYQCNTCGSRSCSIKDKPAWWYKCITCKEFGVYTESKPSKCEYCGSNEVA